MRKLLAMLVVGSVLFTQKPAKAVGETTIVDDIARSSVTDLSVPTGHSVVVSFENDRYIQSIWIDDPAILGVATDRALCTPSNQGGSSCGFASIARLTQLTGAIDLPGSNFSNGNGQITMVTFVTTDRSGENSELYQFMITAVPSSTANSSLVSIIQSQPREAAIPGDARSMQRSAVMRNYDINLIKRGRNRALSSGLADVESEAWNSLEDFISNVDNGMSPREAVGETGVSPSLLLELQQMGESIEV